MTKINDSLVILGLNTYEQNFLLREVVIRLLGYSTIYDRITFKVLFCHSYTDTSYDRGYNRRITRITKCICIWSKKRLLSRITRITNR